MERSAPEPTGIDWQHIRHAAQHFARGLVRECEKQNVARIDSVFQQVCDAISERPRFPRARTSDRKERTWRRSHCRKLLFVWLGGVIDMDPAVTGCWGALQRILTGHSDSLVAAVDHRRNCPPESTHRYRAGTGASVIVQRG